MTDKVRHKFTLSTVALLTVMSSLGYKVEKYGLLVPNIHPYLTELYLCSPIRLNSNLSHYIVGFEPLATREIVHHMVLYGCTKPGNTNPVWSCSEDMGREVAETELETAPPCHEDHPYTLLYAWARNAPNLQLPPDVGFKVGGDSIVQYLVLQIHAANRTTEAEHYQQMISKFTPGGYTDLSGLNLLYTEQPMPKLAGVYVLGAVGSIPAMSQNRWETACAIDENKTIHPFAFRPHTHWLGTVVAGYIVKTDSDGRHHWTLVGKANPQKPHMFYPVANNITVTKGDIAAARCSYKSNRKNITCAGPTDDEEMCNFYIMYYVDEGEPMKYKFCIPGDRNISSYSWDMELNNIPDKEASILDE